MFWHAVRSDPDRIALTSEGYELCYGEFAAAVVSLAGRIRAFDKDRPKLAIILPNGIEFCCAVYAAWQANGIISTHNSLQPDAALEAQFGLVKPDLVVAPPEQQETLERIAPDAGHIFLHEGCFAGEKAHAPPRPEWPVAARDDR